ncbi:MAG: hypothetical protein J6M53_06370 [Bacteroidaceae bacterium]|nr:hypothetical protein [Bacteroidaceae bacterium]
MHIFAESLKVRAKILQGERKGEKREAFFALPSRSVSSLLRKDTARRAQRGKARSVFCFAEPQRIFAYGQRYCKASAKGKAGSYYGRKNTNIARNAPFHG